MATNLQKISWSILKATTVGAKVRKLNMSCNWHQPEPEAPLFFFANHAHLSDPFIAGYFMKNPITYIGNSDGITPGQLIGSALVGLIFKKKGQPDREALKKTMETIRAGHSVGIFPEGDRSWDGETAPILDSTGSLVKKMGVPIMVGRLSGNYLSRPRWAEYPRYGGIFLDMHVLTADKIREMSREDINIELKKLIYNNDIKNDKLKEFEYSCKNLAAGVQFLLWLCPECGASDTITGDGDTIRCEACGKEWTLNGHLGISPSFSEGEDLKDWSDWQKKKIMEIIAGDQELLTRSRSILIGKRIGKKITFETEGDFILYRNCAVFKPLNGSSETVFPVKEMKYYIDNFNRTFEFTFRGNRIAMNFQGSNACKWQFFLQELQA